MLQKLDDQATNVVTIRSQDAVILVPGIMGSRLVDAESHDVLWGLDLSWYGKAWLRNKPWRDLALTDAERTGKTDRVVADALLGFGAFSPVFGGFAPYTYMTERLIGMLADKAALLEFPYDWRLPVTHNATLLADAIDRHIATWRENPAAIDAAKRRPDGREPQVVLIAHSMGGLVCRAMCAIPGAAADVRAVLTLGTPFRGAAKAVITLDSGRGAPFPLPRRRLRRLARTLPGLYDLLPVYRSVEEGAMVRTLEAGDLRSIGADDELSEEARLRYETHSSIQMPNHQTYMGGWQPTVSTLQIRDGEVTAYEHSYNVNSDGSIVVDPGTGLPLKAERFGDGTVPHDSALPSVGNAVLISQQHGSLARVEEALSQASAILLDEVSTPVFLGETELGLDVADLLPLDGKPIIATLTGGDASSTTVSIYDERNRLIDQPTLKRANELRYVEFYCARAGVYRIDALAGGGGAVMQWVNVQDPADDEPDDQYDDD